MGGSSLSRPVWDPPWKVVDEETAMSLDYPKLATDTDTDTDSGAGTGTRRTD